MAQPSVEDIVKLICEQRNPEYTDRAHEFKFLRAALTEKLRGPKDVKIPDNKKRNLTPRAQKSLAQMLEIQTQPEGCYLIRQRVESPRAFSERLQLAHDGGESGQILRHYVGHMHRVGATMDYAGWDEEQREYIETNIDCEQMTIQEAQTDGLYELFGQGLCRVLVWTKDVVEKTAEGYIVVTRPYIKILRREDVVDWHQQNGDYMFITFRECISKVSPFTFERTLYETYTRISAQYVETVTKQEGTQEKQPWKYKRDVNPHGYVPIAESQMGSESASIVSVPASLQFLVLNAESVWSQKIRNQNLNILTVPAQADIDQQIRDITTNTYLKIKGGTGTYAPKWLEYPIQTLTGDKDYIDYLIRRTYESSNTNSKNTEANTGPESGKAKSWNFLDSVPILAQGALSMDAIFNRVNEMWAEMSGQPADGATYKHKTNFDPQGLNAVLEIVIRAMAINVGPTAMTETRRVVRDKLGEIGVTLSPEKKAKSDAEIESMGEQANELPSGVAGRKTGNEIGPDGAAGSDTNLPAAGAAAQP